MRQFISLVGAALVLGTATLQAQSSSPVRGSRFVSRSFGAPFATNVGPHFALIRNRRVLQSTIQAEWILGANRAVAFSSIVEVVAATMLPHRDARAAECWVRDGPFGMYNACWAIDRPRVPVVAFGATPLGFKMYIAPNAPVRFFGQVGGGIVLFDRNTPVVDARMMNFAVDFITGAEFARRAGAAVSVAWKFQHWSNAGTAYMNPGVDANLIYVSIKRQRK